MDGKTELVEFDNSSEERKLNHTDFKKMAVNPQLLMSFRLGKKLGLHFKYDLGLTNIQYSASDPAKNQKYFFQRIMDIC